MPDPRQTPDRSINTSLLVPMVALVLIEMLVFASILIGSGALDRLAQNTRDIMDQQIITRRDSLQSYLVGTVGNLSSLSQTINATTQELVDSGEIDIELLDSSSEEATKLLDTCVGPLITAMRDKEVSGGFIVFNTHSLSAMADSGAFGKKQGVYIRDMDPAATPSTRNEDLTFERAPADVVKNYGITTGKDWKPQFEFAANEERLFDFFYLPWQTAYEAEDHSDASDYAYWGAAPLFGVDYDLNNVSYSYPLVLEDGTVYGVVGMELSADYLRSLMPPSELVQDQGGAYVLGIVDEGSEDVSLAGTFEFTPIVISSKVANNDIQRNTSLTMVRIAQNEYAYNADSTRYFSGCQFFRLYSSNTPFEHRRWMIAGMAPESVLNSFVGHVRNMIALASLLMIALGIIGSIMTARSISKPLRALSNDVSNARIKNAEMPELKRTGIIEVDELTSAITSLSKDIASVRQLEQQRIEHERDYDLLTGLMNRRALYREAGKLFATPSMLKHAALLMIDLDDLKTLNDSYGHDWGDKYIYQAARTFEDGVPDDVIVVRVSGDEFFLLFYGYETRAEIEEQIEQLMETIPTRTVMLPDGETVAIGASGGAAFYPEDSKEFTELMKLADFAMYEAKLAGKGRVKFFDLATYQEQTTVRRAIDELEGLFADHSLVDYHFQPIFNLHSGSVFAYEALMRVALENLRSPTDVVTLSRQEQRMVDVERITWERSFECFEKLMEGSSFSEGSYLFINSFANVSMPFDELATLSSRYPGIMSRTVIEITEAENMSEEATSIKRSIPGFSGFFALDDYGSGYNSEIMLLDLKPKFVKVDITIVRDIDTSIDKQRIMSNVVEYAHERDMRIIAEGVETEGELATCMRIGVDLAQGFYLSSPDRVPKPLSEEAAAQIAAFAEREGADD